jgi:hypothetical protein
MRSILPYAAIILALIAAGSIAFIAWELTKEASGDGDGKSSDDSADQ